MVAAQHRRRGIGVDLVRAGLQVVRQLGVRRVILDVAYGNEPAIALYQQRRFRAVGGPSELLRTGPTRVDHEALRPPEGRMAGRYDGGSVTSSPIRAAGDPLVVGIESSCDETGVGIVRGHELLANEVASSVEQHVRFGGVVPEIASRAHLEAMGPTLKRASPPPTSTCPNSTASPSPPARA